MTEELRGVIFQNPLTDAWETADEYLSGNVREKLDIIEHEYNIPISNELREDVRIMCNLSIGIEERATEKATEKTSESGGK